MILSPYSDYIEVRQSPYDYNLLNKDNDTTGIVE